MLYDQYGHKIDLGKLKHEESAPSLRSVRQVFSSYPSVNITPQRLANIMRMADQGDPHAQCELFEEMEEKDLHLSSILGTRKRAVAGLELVVEPPDGANAREKKATELLTEHLTYIPDITEKLMDVLDAIGKGYSVTEIIWSISKQQAVIEDLRWREPKWFRFDQDSMSEIRMLGTSSPEGEALAPYKYITHIHRAKSGIPVRGGILRPCAWMYLFKNYGFKDWVTFAEIYGQPLRVGKYQANASEQEKDILLQAVANMGTDAAAIIPESMLIEFVESQGKSGSIDLYERLARFCDEQMSKGVLGQTSSSDAMAGGLGSGQANLHGDVRDDLLRADARQLAGTLNRDLARPVIDLNMEAVDRYPKIALVFEDKDDLKGLAVNIEKLHATGLPIGQDYLYKKFNIPKPARGEAVLEVATKPAIQPAAKPVASNGVANTATNAQSTTDQAAIHPADLIAAQAAPLANAAVADWLATIETMLAQADNLEHFRAMLPTTFDALSSDALTAVLADAEVAAHAAGRFDVDSNG